MRKTKKPQCLIINTYRFASHSKSDDGRNKSEVEKWKVNDPLLIAEKEIENVVYDIQIEVKDFISGVIQKAIAAPLAR